MKTIKLLLALTTSVFMIISCKNSSNLKEPNLIGNWVMTVKNKSAEGQSLKGINKNDTSFNSLLNSLKYIPNNSKWIFVNDSILIVSRVYDKEKKADTVIYKINNSRDSLIIISEKVKYKFSKLSNDQVEVFLGDTTVSYILKRSK
jgi:hypothetical protein